MWQRIDSTAAEGENKTGNSEETQRDGKMRIMRRGRVQDGVFIYLFFLPKDGEKKKQETENRAENVRMLKLERRFMLPNAGVKAGGR